MFPHSPGADTYLANRTRGEAEAEQIGAAQANANARQANRKLSDAYGELRQLRSVVSKQDDVIDKLSDANEKLSENNINLQRTLAKLSTTETWLGVYDMRSLQLESLRKTQVEQLKKMGHERAKKALEGKIGEMTVIFKRDYRGAALKLDTKLITLKGQFRKARIFSRARRELKREIETIQTAFEQAAARADQYEKNLDAVKRKLQERTYKVNQYLTVNDLREANMLLLAAAGAFRRAVFGTQTLLGKAHDTVRKLSEQPQTAGKDALDDLTATLSEARTLFETEFSPTPSDGINRAQLTERGQVKSRALLLRIAARYKDAQTYPYEIGPYDDLADEADVLDRNEFRIKDQFIKAI